MTFLMHVFAATIGIGISAAVLLIFASPFIVGILILLKRLRYRDWVVGLAFLFSLLLLFTLGDYLYNLSHWEKSRGLPWMPVVFLFLIFGNPILLAGLILKNTSRKGLTATGMAALLIVTGLGIRQTYLGRQDRDQVAHLRGWIPVNSSKENQFIHADRRYEGTTQRLSVEGHVLEGSPVVLLSDPVNPLFEPQFCSGVAGHYRPAASDPAIPNNITELISLSGCQESVVYPIAVLGMDVKTYVAQPFSSLPTMVAADVQKALPDHVTRQTVFLLNNQTYVAAMNEIPAPRHTESMDEERTLWLLRVDTPKLQRIWPAK